MNESELTDDELTQHLNEVLRDPRAIQRADCPRCAEALRRGLHATATR